MNAPQQEQLRHQYLEAMGISSWLPRTQLPGAAPSPQWVEHFTWPAQDAAFDDDGFASDEPEAAPAVTSPSASGTAKPSVGAAARAQARDSLAALSETAPRQPAPSRAAPQPAPDSPQAPAAPVSGAAPTTEPRRSAQPAPRVKLAFVLAGDLLIVDSLPPASRQGFGNAHQRLLQGIVRALGVQERPSDASLLSWPVLAGATLDQGPAELAKAVQRKLALTLALRPVNRALLLGEAAAQWLLGREDGLDALRGIRFSLQSGVPCVATASLSEALQLPDVKAEIWRDLQPLLTATGAETP
jgi:hypothetical protein